MVSVVGICEAPKKLYYTDRKKSTVLSFKVKVSRKFISDFNSNLRGTVLVLMVMSHCHPLALILLHVTEIKTLVDCLS